MHTPSYEITFNKLDPNGFMDEDKIIINDLLLMINKMADISIKNNIQILEKNKTDYKMEYIVSFIGDYKHNIESILTFSMLYNDVIYQTFKNKYSEKYKLNMSIDYSNFYIDDGCYSMAILKEFEETYDKIGDECNNLFVNNSDIFKNVNTFCLSLPIYNDVGDELNISLIILGTGSLIGLGLLKNKMLSDNKKFIYKIAYNDFTCKELYNNIIDCDSDELKNGKDDFITKLRNELVLEYLGLKRSNNI